MAANDVPCCQPMFWVYLLISVALVCFAGLMSGLTLGLMSLSLVDLEVLAKSGQPKDRKNAEKILPLVKDQHRLLCTLLIYNAMAMEALPIFLDALLPAWGAILISVTLILAFGEIIPQAICSQYGLSVGAKLAVLVRILVIILFPLSYPISKLLDWILGKGHAALLRRSELKTFVDLHANEAGKGGELTHEETTIIGGALQLTEKTAEDAMTDISQVFSLDINAKLDQETMDLIMRKGHSRVPVYSGNPTNIIGLILVKNLIACRAEDETPIRNLTIRKIPRFYDQLPLYNILNLFQKGNSHMGVVVKSKQPLLATLKSNMTPEQFERKGSYPQCLCIRKSQRKKTTKKINARSSENGAHNDAMQLDKTALLPDGEGSILQPRDLDAYPDPNEEVIGIITMEDVMEELLQEEIFDETDEYVEVHDKIRINMVPIIRSSPRSIGPSWRSPAASPRSSYHNTPIMQSPAHAFVASPRSSYHNTPIMQSPVHAFAASPFARPTLLNSPARPRLASPIRHSTSPLKQLSSYHKL